MNKRSENVFISTRFKNIFLPRIPMKEKLEKHKIN